MEELFYKNHTYRRNSDKWYDERCFIVGSELQDELNKIYSEHIDCSKMSIKEIVNEADKYKKSASYTVAINFYKKAIAKCNKNKKENMENAKYIFPRITSCFRKNRQPQKVIKVFEYAKEKYGDRVIDCSMYISTAASYCDLADFEKAKKYAVTAYHMLQGRQNPYLKNVFERINQENIIIKRNHD